jgi:hypothetical protein
LGSEHDRNYKKDSKLGEDGGTESRRVLRRCDIVVVVVTVGLWRKVMDDKNEDRTSFGFVIPYNFCVTHRIWKSSDEERYKGEDEKLHSSIKSSLIGYIAVIKD